MNTPTPVLGEATQGRRDYYNSEGRVKINVENPPTITAITAQQRRTAKAKRKAQRQARRRNRNA